MNISKACVQNKTKERNLLSPRPSPKERGRKEKAFNTIGLRHDCECKLN